MTLSEPTRLNPLRRFNPTSSTHRKPAARLTVPAATVIPFPSTQAAHAQHILTVGFTSPDGRTWHAIGGADTVAAAIAFAQESCPTDATWQPIRWTHLYGD
jgi:hypothetical protein